MKSYTPFLWERMQQLHNQTPTSGHTPGHKNGAFLPEALQTAWGNTFAAYDFTELPGLDNLHFAEDCIADSQRQAAEIFGAKECYYLVNGTTAGLQAAIMATCSNKQVFVPRHVHRSAQLPVQGADGRRDGALQVLWSARRKEIRLLIL